MKKNLSRCEDCGEDTSILTQVISWPEVILLCCDCYNHRYSKEIPNTINKVEEEEN